MGPTHPHQPKKKSPGCQRSHVFLRFTPIGMGLWIQITKKFRMINILEIFLKSYIQAAHIQIFQSSSSHELMWPQVEPTTWIPNFLDEHVCIWKATYINSYPPLPFSFQRQCSCEWDLYLYFEKLTWISFNIIDSCQLTSRILPNHPNVLH